MAQETVSDKAKAEIPYSVQEYTAVFAKPILESWVTPARMIADLLSALEPWRFRLDGVEVKTHSEKLSEYAIVLRRNELSPVLTLTLGLQKLVFAADNPDWSDVDQLVACLNAGLGLVLKSTGATIQTQQLLSVLHVQLKTRLRKDVVAPFVAPPMLKVLGSEITFPGIILHGETSSIVIDASLAYANGLFIRMTRQHSHEAEVSQVARLLREDEARLFSLLGLEVDL